MVSITTAKPFEIFQAGLPPYMPHGLVDPARHADSFTYVAATGKPGHAGKQRFKPDLTLRSLRDLTPARLKALGDIRGVIFDMDDTLIRRHAESFEDNVISRLKALQQAGFQIGIVTNNNSGDYCRRLRGQLEREGLHLPFVENAIKPTTAGFKAMFKQFDLRPDQVVAVGDNCFTDTFGGHRAGMKTVLAEWYFHPSKKQAIPFYATQVKKLIKRKIKYAMNANAGPRFINFEPHAGARRSNNTARLYQEAF
jgi:HAD superfamily phosphatase (TIGR01668 family)